MPTVTPTHSYRRNISKKETDFKLIAEVSLNSFYKPLLAIKR